MISQECMRPLSTEIVSAPAMTLRARLHRFMQHSRALHERERLRIRAEILRIPGLMGLLMKPRNGERWSTQDHQQLRAQLRGLGRLGLYVMTMAIPGTALTLPLLAWWLDRRSQRRTAETLSEIYSGKDTTPPTR